MRASSGIHARLAHIATSRPLATTLGFVALIAVAEITYSQTMACAEDEGYHLLAAQLILSGKRPYLDFLFPQTPLNAYWNAFWMGVLGQAWRPIHLVAALETIGAVLLTAIFVNIRFPVASWRLAAALTAAVVFGLNAAVFSFGAVAQPYGICLLLTVGAYWAAVGALERSSLPLSGIAGACATAAAASSLLTAPVAPLLLAWLVIYSPPQRRIANAAAFCGAALVTLLPTLWLFHLGPRQVFFGAVEYHLLYRRSDWPGALSHDADVLTAWVDSGQALLLIVLSAVALRLVWTRSDWPRLKKAEYYLCAWLAAGLAIHLSNAHPTFSRYYLLLVPFLAVLAPLGLYAVGSKMGFGERPLTAWLAVAVLCVLALGKSVRAEWDDVRWHDYEELSAKVDAVTPKDARVFADEQVYFLARRIPPEGQEYSDSHKLHLAPALASMLHVVPRADAYRHITENYFQSVVMCDDDAISELDLPKRYANRQEFPAVGCSLFW